MTARELRVGLVGIGDIGRMHAAAWTNAQGIELVVAGGRDPQRASRLAAELGVDHAQDFAEVLADPGIDAVDLCVPNHLHAEYVLAALEAGKHVLCEKPIALTVKDATAMVELARAKGLAFMVGHTVRYWPCYTAARREIRSGRIGEVSAYSARRMLSLLRATDGAEGWRQHGELTGGAVLDLQIHDLDFIAWTFGMPRSVVSRGIRSATGAYDHVWTLLQYDNGLCAGVESSFMLQGNPVTMDFRAIGSAGSLEFAFVQSDFGMHGIEASSAADQVDIGGTLRLYRWGAPSEALARDPADPVAAAFALEIADFTRTIRDPHTSRTAQGSIDALRLALASRESCESGEVVVLDDL
jgi:predicted dehydrogenase